MAELVKKIIYTLRMIIAFGAVFLYADELPKNEIQVTFNGYFDNFRVHILYPTVSFTKKIGGSTSITGRYLVDCITAASMRSRFEIDGVTSATSQGSVDAVTSASQRGSGYPETTFDEVRHELNAGLYQLIGEGSLSMNLLYSTEHDYRSWTLAAQMSYPFAMKNTTVQIGLVRNWDRIFPDTRYWIRGKDVITASAALTQVLAQTWIMQTNLSVTRMSGYLSDPYQPVPIFQNNTLIYHETVLPDTRLRKAVGIRSNWMWSKNSSIRLGYRYYWDDWDIRSHTADILLQHYAAKKEVIYSLGLRYYTQTHASFFKNEYSGSTGYLTVDSKLKDLRSNEFELGLTIKGTYFDPGDLFYSEKMEYHLALGFYRRHTPTPDWFSGYTTLYAYTVSLGFRYYF